METYLIPIKTAILFFPVVAFLITLPYMVMQYRKYGAIPVFRSVVVYSFVLYLMCAYFLIILPLPPIEEVSKYTTPIVQLIPFQFVVDMVRESSFQIQDVSSYSEIFINRSIYQVLYNILLTVPFGVYLRYYFKCSFKRTACFTFLLSLFFELTQLTGLYGIYPRSYRLFDVDDLMINTLGGMVGYFLMPIFAFLLPSKDRLDQVSYERGVNVSYVRRIFAFVIDVMVILVLESAIRIIVSGNSIFAVFKFGLTLSYVLTIIVYFVIFPRFYHDSTIGKYFLKLKISTLDDSKVMGRQILVRYGLLYLFYLPSMIYAFQFLELGVSSVFPFNLCFFVLSFLFVIVFFYFWCHLLFSMFRGNRVLCYEKMSKTKNVSTIEVGMSGKKETVVDISK